MTGAILLVLLAVAPAPSAAAAAQDPGPRIESIRERIRTSLQALEGKLARLDDLTASYAGAAAPTDAAARETLRREVEAEGHRLNESFSDFWPVWDAKRMAQGARLMGNIIAGKASPQAGSSFLDSTEIDDFKDEVSRTQKRRQSALDREEAAHKAFQNRSKGERLRRLLYAAAGAAAAALSAGALWLLRSGSS